MKPAIYTDPDDSRLRWLVDCDSISVNHFDAADRQLSTFRTAVNLQNLEPGQYRLLADSSAQNEQAGFDSVGLSFFEDGAKTSWGAGLVLPRPCIYAIRRDHSVQYFNNKEERVGDIYRRSAEVLLWLAASFQNVHFDSLSTRIDFGKERTGAAPKNLPKGVRYIPWDLWKFHIAWKWSAWKLQEVNSGKKVSIQQRFESMKADGFPNGLKSFEKIHGELFPTR